MNGQKITAASISGQWGNGESGTTAHNLLYLDNVLVTNSRTAFPNPSYNSFVPWSYDFTDFSIFEDGNTNFSAFQISEGNIYLGWTTLVLETESDTIPVPSPEPTSFLLIGCGLIGMIKWGRAKK